MYSVLQYGQMIADRVRMQAYATALERSIRPGHLVLDVGTGTGIFALIACRLGAGRVVAVEPAPAIHAARALAAANGCAERIHFVQAPLEDLELESRADVIVADLRGTLPFSGRHLPTMRLARERFLAPGGVLLPRRDRIHAVPVEAPELYRRHVTSWTENSWALDLEPARELAVNALWAGGGAEAKPLASPAHLASVDYRGGPDPDLRASVDFTVAQPGTAHALCLWFDAEIAEGLGFSNAPDEPELVYGRLCLPLSRPLEVRPGERLGIALSALLQGDDYLWSWRTTLQGAEGGVRARMQQSTFLGTPLACDALGRRDLAHRPELGEAARVDRFVLCQADGRRSLESIARATAERFPARFRDARAAAGHVGALLERYALPAPRARLAPGREERHTRCRDEAAAFGSPPFPA